jgi:predicted PolB exonuclease-like 3'-5' exonuclease
MSILVFDIETIPCLESGRKLYDLQGLSDTETHQAMLALRRAKVGHDFLPHHLQKIVAISLVLATPTQLKVWSLGDENSDEKELIHRFFLGLDKHTPTLVSWNGSGFDLPVLHYRALLHRVQAPTYWETGENIQSFKWNNYLSRFHQRHIDLMDLLAGYQNKAFAPLDEISTMLGYPGKMGMDGSKVFEAYQNHQLKAIRDYCETDVLNTYCVYLQFEHMRGNLSLQDFEREHLRLKTYLLEASNDAPHLKAFLVKMNG